MASHSGIRGCSGRSAGPCNKVTSGFKLNLSELARDYTNDAPGPLVEVMQSSQSDSARITATTAILQYLIEDMAGQRKQRRLKLMLL